MWRWVQWIRLRGEWRSSEWALPHLRRETQPDTRRWMAVAGGLALILSRVPPSEQRTRFASTLQAYALIRRRLRQSRPVDAGAGLLNDVMHEVAEVADPVTRSGLHSSFQAAVRRAAQAHSRPASREGGRGSQHARLDAA